jgi:ribokinase
MSDHLIIVPGGLNTDIIASGVNRIIKAGQLSLGGEFKVGPGGKARNMAQMAAAYLGPGKVAMIGRSSRDPLGLWRFPIDSLNEAGVDISHVKILGFEESRKKYPGIALIPVDTNGRNQIYVLPGVNADFNLSDIDSADILFYNPDKSKLLMLALEIPLKTAQYAIEKAFSQDMKIVLDPGGITDSIDEILNEKIYAVKPNEHEIEIITGKKVTDFTSARAAGKAILNKGVRNVFITHGDRGGYLINQNIAEHIPIPQLKLTGSKDETGCGDQVTAILTACLSEGLNIREAARKAILAGTLQFYRSGIMPLERSVLEHYIQELGE